MRIISLSIIVLLLGTACQTPQKETITLSSQIDTLLAAHPDFSGVVLVADAGKPVFHKAFGYRDVENKLPVDTTTVFELASVSKTFTSMIIMMLREEGKLFYDNRLEQYIPELPYPEITIRHLLTHTSGLPDYHAVMDENWDKAKVAGNKEIIQYLIAYHPERRFAPGTKYEYSNTGYVLLATIAEIVSGKDFITLCRERIFTPVGMTTTDIRTLEEKAAVNNFARGYILVPEKNRYVSADSFPSSNYIVWLGSRKGPGRVSSTSNDLLKWDRALYSENLVKRGSLGEAFTPYILKNDSISNYGFGWMISKDPTLGQKIWHTGSNPGYSTRLVRFIDVDKTIIILSNNAYPRIKEIDHALDSLLAQAHQRITQ
jgi:CubicO group peptidase (beta-lactamase class C family)